MTSDRPLNKSMTGAQDTPNIRESFNPDQVPMLNEASSFAEAFVACLRVLVEEEETQQRHTKPTPLVNGERVDAVQKIYSFVLEDDLEIIEGSRVKILLNDQSYDGNIISISNLRPKILLLKCEKDLGERVKTCKIIEDLSTLHKSLLARYEKELDLSIPSTKWMKKVESDFAFADRVLTNKVKKLQFMPPIVSGELNSDQHEFITKALGHDISFLWGPPGTGKTKCLSSLISVFYDVPERTIIGSNTNQAVDQVLLKLCRDLVANGRYSELEEGKIIRVGYIQNSELLSEFGDLINLKQITERKSQKIQLEIIQRETQIAEVSLELSRFPEQQKRLESLIYWQKQCTNIRGRHAHAENQLLGLEKNHAKLQNEKQFLANEIADFHNKSFISKLFGKSLTSLETELHSISIRADEAELQLTNSQKHFDEITKALTKATTQLNAFSEEEKNLTVAQLKIKKNRCEQAKENAEEQLKILREKLEKVSETVLQEARIFGATLSKIFLIPHKIGKCDNLIIDEASMAILPDVHFASSLAQKRVVISGDFRQIPPILVTKNQVVSNEIGRSIFDHARTGFGPIKNLFLSGKSIPNMQMLEWQYRMPQKISNLVSDFAYGSKLKTAPLLKSADTSCPTKFNDELIIVDTSATNANCEINSSGSRSNVLHAVIAERIIREFTKQNSQETIAFCSPFKAQTHLVRHTLDAGGLLSQSEVGTVHVLQGDEKDTIIFDTVDGHISGIRSANFQISESSPDTAQLLTVAVSRAKRRLIILANLDLLRRTLPHTAFMRKIFETAITAGNVISSETLLPSKTISDDARASFYQQSKRNDALFSELTARASELTKLKLELMALKQKVSEDLEIKISELKEREQALVLRDVELQSKESTFDKKSKELDRVMSSTRRDLKAAHEASSKFKHEAKENEERLVQLIKKLELEYELLKRKLGANAYTLVQEKDFAELFEADALAAQHSVVIYSGFVSANRIRKSSPLIRQMIKKGIKVRAVLKQTPKKEFFWKDGKSAVDMLKELGVKVDLRAETHQKAVLIDNSILWVGSLNPLSYNESLSDETMLRMSGGLSPLKFAQSVALRGEYSIKSLHDLAKPENPICYRCGGDMEFSRKRKVRQFTCLNCKTITPLWKKKVNK